MRFNAVMLRGSLEDQADRILIANDCSGMTRRVDFKRKQTFWPSGPARSGARGRCINCRGPASGYGMRCRSCLAGIPSEGAVAMDYWMDVWEGQEPDFAPILIEYIAQREHELGLPAARWPTSESAGVTT